MKSSTFNGETWILQLLDSNQPKWKKLEERKIPQMMTGREAIVYVPQSDQLFVLDNQNRILKSIQPLL